MILLAGKARQKLEIVLFAPVQGEAGGKGVWPASPELQRGEGEFRPPTCPPKFQRRRGPASSVRIFSNRHRQLGNLYENDLIYYFNNFSIVWSSFDVGESIGRGFKR